ncbi:uncharacterized protein LOC130949674 [Arachis stenosperma]|uniref:uncharacterized protein LOC130949674 n=1 Tax=Arachis stenosperma TaxID=217475 RepID=UPI0025ACB6CE|nr:uncharacterized protein LOC130949674 [Arachis stenosperma]
MITISDERSVEEVHTQTKHLQDIPRESHEERNHAPHPTHREELKKGETLNPYAPFPQRLKGGVAKRMYSKFLHMFASLDVNIPFIKALQKMPSYIKYIKELLAKKISLKGGQTIKMNRKCSALIQTEPPTEKKDPGSFHIPYAIGETMIDKGLYDLGANINLMPLPFMKKLQINELTPTDVIIKLANKTQKKAIGVVENVLVKVGNYFLPTDFVILEMEENHIHPIILGRPFLATARALIDVERGELILRIHDEHLTFNVFKPSQEADHDNKESREDHNKELMKETSMETQASHLRTLMIDKQGGQKEQQPSVTQEELDPPESYEASNRTLLKEETTRSKVTSRETKKKAPRGWRNKKIPTEGFSLGDEVVSAYIPPIPPHLPTIPSQLPQMYTISKILSLEHMELLNKANGNRFTARGEDLKQYQPP